jgi:hypothetical protein
MPEYLYPGVYVEEYDAHTSAVEGAFTSRQREDLQSLVARLVEIARDRRPHWTDLDDADSGVTLVALAGYLLSEAHKCPPCTLPERRRAAILRTLAVLSESTAPCAARDGTSPRPRYFAGQLLTDADLRAEQTYHREKLQRHNRLLHGVGIVHGLSVCVERAPDAPRDTVRIAPGVAIDPCGNELVLERGASLGLPREGERFLVSLRHGERPDVPIASVDGESSLARIEEIAIVALVDSVVEPKLALARLLRAAGGWIVDSSFEPRRALPGPE